VLEHLAGAGRHKGRLGALLVELVDGTRFAVGTGIFDAESDTPPPIGAVISFRYQELSEAGVPRFPSYVGIRADAAWPGATPATPPPPAEAAALQSPGTARRFELEAGAATQPAPP